MCNAMHASQVKSREHLSSFFSTGVRAYDGKDQLISKELFGVLESNKKTTKFFKKSNQNTKGTLHH